MTNSQHTMPDSAASDWTIRLGSADDAPRAMAIWRAAVDATHGFLLPDDRMNIDAALVGYLPHAPLLMVERDGRAFGFMVMIGDKIEALFIDPVVHGMGAGSALIAHALASGRAVLVDANVDADNALPFYRAKGFVEIGRSPLDGDGRPYPIVHLRHDGQSPQ